MFHLILVLSEGLGQFVPNFVDVADGLDQRFFGNGLPCAVGKPTEETPDGILGRREPRLFDDTTVGYVLGGSSDKINRIAESYK